MNVYELVTAKIVERLEEGVIPWQKCWTSGPAKSLTTGKEYRGLNSLLLGPEVAKLSPGAIWPSLSWTFPKTAQLGKVPCHLCQAVFSTEVSISHWAALRWHPMTASLVLGL
jgi:antirestriction factor ArdC-like protein